MESSYGHRGVFYQSCAMASNDMYLIFGHVGIGTTNPGAKLQVNGQIQFAGDTRQGLFSPYNISTGYAFGLEQVSVAQSGDYAATRLFASSAGNAYIGFGHYTSATAFSEQMRISGAGNVGIGTTAPTYKLHVNNNATAALTDSYGLRIDAVTGTAGASKTYGLYVNASGSDDANYAAIFASGNVGIGTASPQANLEIVSSATTNTAAENVFAPSLTAANYVQRRLGVSGATNNSSEMRFYYAGSGSTSNRLDLGCYGSSNGLSLLAKGNVAARLIAWPGLNPKSSSMRRDLRATS